MPRSRSSAADKRLKFFNAAFAALWGIDAAWLALEPTLDEVLEWLRERRRLPEYVDFRAFKRERATLFTLADRDRSRNSCTCPTDAPCGCRSRRIRWAGCSLFMRM